MTQKEKYNWMKNELLEFALDVVQQYGHLTGKKRKFYWAGGLSTLERALDLLKRGGVSKSNDRIWEYEIKRFLTNRE